jgi:hypothetical protein
MRTEFWWGNLTEGDRLEDLYLDGRIAVVGLANCSWSCVNCVIILFVFVTSCVLFYTVCIAVLL